ncbi:hypothetical protein Mpsy_0155 [Methanolobus psychrophilus R15]|nr:hypothetical protein Mpsy_0155 [Methanolobus psychrophilus R15]
MMVEYEYAFSSLDEVVWIEDVKKISKEASYICPDCGEKMMAKVGDLRAHHFAHYANSTHTGTGESIVHSNSKLCLYHYLKNHLEKRQSPSTTLRFKFNAFDTQYHTTRYSPLQNIDSIELEYRSQIEYVPDVALLSQGELHTAIEIVHTHDDSPEKKEFYQENGIDVLYIPVSVTRYCDFKQQFETELPYFRWDEMWLEINGNGDNVNIISDIKRVYSEYVSLQDEGWQIANQYRMLENDYQQVLNEARDIVLFARITDIMKNIVLISAEMEDLKKQYNELYHEYLTVLQEIENYKKQYFEQILAKFSPEYEKLSKEITELLAEISLVRKEQESIINEAEDFVWLYRYQTMGKAFKDHDLPFLLEQYQYLCQQYTEIAKEYKIITENALGFKKEYNNYKLWLISPDSEYIEEYEQVKLEKWRALFPPTQEIIHTDKGYVVKCAFCGKDHLRSIAYKWDTCDHVVPVCKACYDTGLECPLCH